MYHLNLKNSLVNDQAIHTLQKNLTNIQILNLQNCAKLTTDCFKSLQKYKELLSINVAQNNWFTDYTFTKLRNFKHIEYLELSKTKITSLTLQELSEYDFINQLRYLGLSFTYTDD